MTQDITDKIVAAQINSEVAAVQSVKTNEILDRTAKAKLKQWAAEILTVAALIWAAAVWCTNNSNTQAQQAGDIGKLTTRANKTDEKVDKMDVKINGVQNDTQYIRGVLRGWQQGPLQPVMSARRNDGSQ